MQLNYDGGFRTSHDLNDSTLDPLNTAFLDMSEDLHSISPWNGLPLDVGGFVAFEQNNSLNASTCRRFPCRMQAIPKRLGQLPYETRIVIIFKALDEKVVFEQ
jgi:hypothetical protein